MTGFADRVCTGSCAGPRGDVAVELLRDPLAFLEAAAARHGGAASLVLGGERVVLVSDPGLAQAVLIDQAADFVKVDGLHCCAANNPSRERTLYCASSVTLAARLSMLS